jgi:two-component system cell cycle response regulator DivK
MVKILLVEDNEMNMDILRRRLEMEDFDVVVAEDGERAIEKAKTDAPDLIIMDMGLPKVDGWTATGHIKGIDDTCHIPIIALTAHAMAGDRQRCMSIGCDEYDTKPIDFFRLFTKIQNVLA